MEEKEFKEYILILRGRAWIVILITTFLILISGLTSYYILTPKYQAFTTIMVGKPQDYNERIEYTDALLNEKLVSTYREIASSRVISNEVIKNLELDITHDTFQEKIKAMQVGDSEIIKIEVVDENLEMSAKIANEMADVFIKNITKIMKIKNVVVIDKAETPIKQIEPKPIINMIIAGILGLMGGIFLVLFYEYMDNTIKTSDDIEKNLGLSVIGIIPDAS